VDEHSTSSPVFAVVQDVAASWADYGQVRRALDGQRVPGLILHAAGPTDEGYRTIEVWDSEESWRSFCAERLRGAYDGLATPPLVRELEVRDLVPPPASTASEEERCAAG
jgi:hypothetical protein